MELKGVKVHQSENGGIYMVYDCGFTLLEEQQVINLGIDIDKIKDFSTEEYSKFYVGR